MLVNLCKLLHAGVHDMNDDIVTLKEQIDRLRDQLRELAPDGPFLSNDDSE